MDIDKKIQEQKAGEDAIQNQVIGDNNKQFVAKTQYNTVVNGAPINDIISLTATVSAEATRQAVAMCTRVAEETVLSRMSEFEKIWVPKISGMENAVNNLIDPKFQFMIRDANITAAKSSREEDLAILAELLACHIEKGDDKKIDSGINKAIDIVNEVDLDSLCALTILLTVLNITPLSSDIDEGLGVLNNLYRKLLTCSLPKGDAWIDNLNVVGAINILSGNFYKLDKLMSARLDGFMCTGIKVNSDEHMQAISILERNGLPKLLLTPNKCLSDHVCLPIAQISRLKPEIKPIIELYSKDKTLIEEAKANFMNKWDSYEALKTVKDWINNIPLYFRVNSVGKALAQTNAKRCYPGFPDLIN